VAVPRERLGEKLDVLVIDEAGQISLADALAMGTSAKSLILLGDPLQLAQVTQGVHPPGSGCSVLEHLLDEGPTIPEDRGIFLERTRRMHPVVCRFISEAF
jgi:superfamily I DNA and/or RNA helicase